MVQTVREFNIGSFLEKKAGISSFSYMNTEKKVAVPKETKSDIIAKIHQDEELDDCPVCGCHEMVLDHSRAEHICTGCGTVLEERIIDTSKFGWRVFDQDDAANKVSAEVVKIDGKMTTVIGPAYCDYSGKKLDSEMSLKMKRLAKKDFRVKETRDDKVIREAINEMRIIAGKIGLSNKIRDEAVMSFRRAIKGKPLRGKSILALMASILLKTCKENKIPFKLTEFSKQSNINRKKLSSTYSDVVRDTNSRSLSSPIDFLPRFCSELHLTDPCSVTAHNMLKKMMDDHGFLNLSIGKESAGYAAASVYIASLEHNLQPIREMRLVAIVTNVAESTLKKRVEEMVGVLGLDQNKYREEKYLSFSKSERVRYRLKPEMSS